MNGQQPGRSGRLVLAIVVTATVVTATAADLARGNPQPKDALHPQVAKLLEIGWGESFRVLKPSGEAFDEAKRLAPADARVPFAFALVNIKHRKYDDAKKLLEEAIRLDEKYLAARKASIWVEMLLKRYEAALVEIEQLAAFLPTEAADRAADTADVALAQFIGRLFGFLEGPAKTSVKEDVAAAVKARVLARISPAMRRELAAGGQRVADQFAELYLTREQTKEDAQAAEAKSQQREANRLAEDRKDVAEDKAALTDQVAKTREELDRLLSDLEKKLEPLDREYSRLSARAATVRDRILDYDREIGRYVALLDVTDEPAIRLRYQIEIDRLDAIQARYVADYRVLERQAAAVGAQRGAILSQRDATLARYNAEAKRLGKEGVKLRRDEQRIARDEQRNERPPSGNTPKVRLLSRKAFAFTTYEPFPLEQAKAELLKAVK